MAYNNVALLYAEPELHATRSLDGGTYADLRERGPNQIVQRFQQSRLPPIRIDPEATDIYPPGPDSTKLEDVEGPVIVVLWPLATPPEAMTPSPMVAHLRGVEARLQDTEAQFQDTKARLNAQQLINETSTTKSKCVKITTQSDLDPPTLERLMSDMSMMKQEFNGKIGKLEERIEKLEEKYEKLEEEVQDLKKDALRSRDEITELQKAVIGDHTAISAIRIRVLLYYARQQLAIACGWDSWEEMEKAYPDCDKLYHHAQKLLADHPHWNKLLVSSGETPLRTITHNTKLRQRASNYAHNLKKHELVSFKDSIEGLHGKERVNMEVIYSIILDFLEGEN